MADINLFFKPILGTEGGNANDPDDHGGPTRMGVTLKVWQKHGYDKDGDGTITEKDLWLINQADVMMVMRKAGFWKSEYDKYDQALADSLANWAWGAGHGTRRQWAEPFVKFMTNGLPPESLTPVEQRFIGLLLNVLYTRYLFGFIASEAKQGKWRRGWMLKHLAMASRWMSGFYVKHSVFDKAYA